jgi:hypothetical protein
LPDIPAPDFQESGAFFFLPEILSVFHGRKLVRIKQYSDTIFGAYAKKDGGKVIED